jgi:hypothetical protein
MTPFRLFKRIESLYLKLLNIYKLSKISKLSKEHESLKEYNLIFLGLNRYFNLRTDIKLRNLKTRLIGPS